MGMLDQVQNSKTSKLEGARIIIAGQEKIGKTTLACSFPNALLIPIERGYVGVDCDRVDMIESYPQFLDLLREIWHKCKEGQFQYRNIVIDSLTALERLMIEEVIESDYSESPLKNIASVHGGFGKGMIMVKDKFTALVKTLDLITKHFKVNVIVTSHVFSATITDPNIGTYLSWDLLASSPKDSKSYGIREFATQWADLCGFLYEPGKMGGENKAVSLKKGRVLGVSRTHTYVAGNRYDLEDEIPIPKPPENGAMVLIEAIKASRNIDIND